MKTFQTATSYAGANLPLRSGYQIAVHNPTFWNKPGTWIFAFIRLATGSFWNHWAGIYVREDGAIFVIEMRGGGKKRARRMTRWDIWLQRRPDRVYEVIPYMITPALTIADLDKENGGYDYYTLLIGQPVFLLTKIWIKKKEDKSRTCSEYWARVLKFG